jgi:hypothetical protein
MVAGVGYLHEVAHTSGRDRAIGGGGQSREVGAAWGDEVDMARMWIAPVIPVVANLLLAALWGLSVFAGWGLEAFCSTGEESDACGSRLGNVAVMSGIFAIAAACCWAGAWIVPGVRRDPRRFSVLMSTAVGAWVAAEGVLFVGGVATQ